LFAFQLLLDGVGDNARESDFSEQHLLDDDSPVTRQPRE
jgi:hypothetical protein